MSENIITEVPEHLRGPEEVAELAQGLGEQANKGAEVHVRTLGAGQVIPEGAQVNVVPFNNTEKL